MKRIVRRVYSGWYNSSETNTENSMENENNTASDKYQFSQDKIALELLSLAYDKYQSEKNEPENRHRDLKGQTQEVIDCYENILINLWP